MLNFKNIKTQFSPDTTSGNKPFYVFFLFLLLFCCEAKTQTEYITNGSFEQIDSCYGNFSNLGEDVFEWSGCKGWSNPIYSSSDLWCFGAKNPIQQPPALVNGYQFAKTGNNFTGIYVSFNSFTNYREYIQNRLSQTLIEGRNYLITLYINQGMYIESCSPITIGIKFFNTKFKDSLKKNLNYFVPDVINNTTLLNMDTLNWQLMTFNYKATGNENYVVIGNFQDSLHLKYTEPCDTTGWGNVVYATNYFYIDDVSIIEIPQQDLIFPNVFTPNEDGINDKWEIKLPDFVNINFCIFNRWGNKVLETFDNNISWDSSNNYGEKCTDGIYYYILNAEYLTKEKIYKKGFIHLIR